MKRYEKKGWFSVELPDFWVVEEDEEPVALYDPDGAGVIHVAVQDPRPRKPGDRLDVFLFLKAFLRGAGVSYDERDARRYSQEGSEAASVSFTSRGPEGKLRERIWFFTNQEFLLFVNYTCREEERAVEEDEVDRIIAGIRLTSGR